VTTVTLDLYELSYSDDDRGVFASTNFDVLGYPGSRIVAVEGESPSAAGVYMDFDFDADEARSLAAALLAAADASEATP